MPSQDICPSVRLSVTRRYSIETVIYVDTLKFFYRWVATPFQFLRTKRYCNIPTGTSLTGTSNARGYKKSQFSTNISLYLGNKTKQSHSYYERRIGNRTQAFEWYNCNDLE